MSKKNDVAFEKSNRELVATMENQLIASVKRILIQGTVTSTDVADTGIEGFVLREEGGKEYQCVFSETANYVPKEIAVGNRLVVAACKILNAPVYTVTHAALYNYSSWNLLHSYVEKVNAIRGEKHGEKKREDSELERKLKEVSPALRSNILDQLGKADYTGEGFPLPEGATSTRGMALKYELCKSTYTKETQITVEELLQSHHRYAETRLRIALTNTHYHPELVTSEEMRAALDSSIYGLEEEKNKLCRALAAANKSRCGGAALLFIAPKGSGIHTLTETFCNARRKSHFSVPCGTLSSLTDTAGVSPVYEGSKEGKFASDFASCGTTDATVVLKDVDTIPTYNKDGNPHNTLYSLIGDGLCPDNFAGIKLDCRASLIICTASNENKIDPALLRCFESSNIIRFQPYTNEDKLAIAKSHLIPALKQSFSIEADALFTEDALEHIIADFCYDGGCAQLKEYLKVCLTEAEGAKAAYPLSSAFADKIINSKSLMLSPEYVCSKYITRLPENDRTAVRKLLEESQLDGDSTGAKEIALKKLKLIAGILRPRENLLPFNLNRFNETLNRSHYGLEPLKRKFARTMNYAELTGKAANILLIGPPGTGKTSIAASVGEGCGKPYAKVSLNGVSDAKALKGTPSFIHGATCGKIGEALVHTGLNAVIQLDEIDSMSPGYEIVSALLDLLDSKQFYEDYLGITADCSNVTFIATANHIENIPAELLDRFEVIMLNGYTKSEKKTIFKEKVFPAILREMNSTAESYRFSDAAIDFMIDHYTQTSGVRELIVNGRDIIRDVIMEHSAYTVETEDVIRLLGQPPILRGNRPPEELPGVVNALSVNSYSGLGGAFTVETVADTEDRITGLAKDSLLESVAVAKAVAGTVYPGCRDMHFFVHFAEGGVAKDGPSAGIAITISILSCALGVPVSQSLAFTGEIDPLGFCWAVGGVPQKVQAACDAGCKTVFIPLQNYEAEAEKLKAFEGKIEIIPVRRITEIIERVFPSVSK